MTKAFEFGNQQNSETELFSCLAFNTDFRIVNTSNSDSQAIVIDGGELTIMNCNVTAIATASTTTKELVGVEVKNGGQAVMTNCEVTVDATGTAGSGSKSYGFVVASDSRIKLTGCSVLAKKAATNVSIQPNPGDASRMQADACLLTPAWTSS